MPITKRAAETELRQYFIAVSRHEYVSACADSTQATQRQLIQAAIKHAVREHHRLSSEPSCPAALRSIADASTATAQTQARFGSVAFTTASLNAHTAQIHFTIASGTGRGHATMVWTTGQWRMQNYAIEIFKSYLGTTLAPTNSN